MKALNSKYMTSAYEESLDLYYINNKKSGANLGAVEYFGPWKQFVFFAESDLCIFSADCLQDIINFITDLNKEAR